jgi:hypothetical protein
MVNVIQVDVRHAQAVVNGVKRQFVCRKWNGSFTMLNMGEPLFLCSGEQNTIFNQTGGRIMEDSIDTECIHNEEFRTFLLSLKNCSGAGLRSRKHKAESEKLKAQTASRR